MLLLSMQGPGLHVAVRGTTAGSVSDGSCLLVRDWDKRQPAMMQWGQHSNTVRMTVQETVYVSKISCRPSVSVALRSSPAASHTCRQDMLWDGGARHFAHAGHSQAGGAELMQGAKHDGINVWQLGRGCCQRQQGDATEVVRHPQLHKLCCLQLQHLACARRYVARKAADCFCCGLLDVSCCCSLSKVRCRRAAMLLRGAAAFQDGWSRKELTWDQVGERDGSSCPTVAAADPEFE